jgi:hypothetical protein
MWWSRDCRDLPHELERSFNRLGLGRGSGANATFWGNVAFGGRGGRESAVVADVPRQVPHRGPTGVTQGLVRVSVGIENWRDLLREYTEALDAI